MSIRMNRSMVCLVGFALALFGGAERLLKAEPPQPVNTWASIGTADPLAARTGAAVATLADGTTLVAGGLTADGAATTSVVVHHPLTHASTRVGQLLVARVNAAATRLDGGRVLVTGGTVGNAYSAEAEVFDPATGTSTFVALMAQPRAGHASALLADGTVLIVGGASADGVVLASTERFDPSTNSITPGVSMAVARAGASATTLLDGRVLVAGGHDGARELASAEIYQPFDDTFQAADTPMSVARSGHSAVLLPHNNAVLIAGGTSAGSAVSTTDLFLPAVLPDPYSWGMGSFTSTGAMVQARSQAVAAPWGDDGYAFAIGGGSGDGAADGEVYRFATVKTDKDDYAPGERAVITGSGWEPNEDVTLLLQEDPAVHPDYELVVRADSEGNFRYDQWAPEGHDAGVRFYLMATGRKSKAQITFTDGNLSSAISFTLGGLPGAAGTSTLLTTPGAVVNWSVAVTCVDGSNGNTCLSEGYTVGGAVQSGYTVVIQRATNSSFAQNLVSLPAVAVNAAGAASGTVTVPTTGGPYYYRARHDLQSLANVPVQGLAANAWQLVSSGYVQARIQGAANQALVTIAAPASATYGQTGLSVVGGGGSGTGAFSYRTSSESDACTVNSTTGALTITQGTGSCEVTAHRAGDTTYLAASSVPASIAVNTAPLTITASDRAKTYGDVTTFDLTAPSSDFSVEGLVAGDAVASVTLASTGEPATAAMGAHAIVPSAAVAGPGTNLGNYAVQYVNGTLTVRYGICPLYDSVKPQQTGSTVPVKFSLCNSSGQNVSAANLTVVAAGISNADGSVTLPATASGNANPGNAFRFTDGFYIYNLKTAAVPAGSWKLMFTVNGQAGAVSSTARSAAYALGFTVR